jgi:Na+/proline symporter
VSDEADIRRSARRGVVFFAIYTAFYAAFVGVAAFGTFAGGSPSGGLASTAVLGLPWGVVAGFGLIGGAFVLAVMYAVLAGRGGTR